MHTNYWVWENVPPPREKGEFEFDFDSLPILHDLDDHGRLSGVSARNPALGVDLELLRVHHVERAVYTTQEFSVERPSPANVMGRAQTAQTSMASLRARFTLKPRFTSGRAPHEWKRMDEQLGNDRSRRMQ